MLHMRAHNSRVLAATAALLLFASLSIWHAAMAGDDVNYSAPYLVVEDGKLVTKYPAREHDPNAAAPAAGSAAGATTAGSSASPRWLVAAIASLTVVAGLFWLTRRRSGV